ncbi:MAG: ABC transporter ATP-binding protein [Variibacter sp.]
MTSKDLSTTAAGIGRGGSPPSDAVIDARNVCFSYTASGNASVLKDVSFECRPGEFFSLLGPSGCGKTTVLRLIAGFDYPTAGTLTADGQAISGPGINRGVVFQGDDSLFNWLTAMENVGFGARLRGRPKAEQRDVARRFMDLVGLKGHERKYPQELSGGMRQRIQIARVLANDPSILLMDEPFGALDAQTRNELQDELSRIWAETKKTVVFITHDIAEAVLLSDRVGVMTSGPNATIREIVEIDLPRPRMRSHVDFGRLYERINELIIDEVRKSRARHRDEEE